MRLIRRFAWMAFAALCACSGGGSPQTTPVTHATPTPTPTATPTLGPDVTIDVSASTNSAAYSIVLQTDASATVTQGSYTGTTTISSTDTATFFNDLNADSPVADVQTDSSQCVKSSSFATTTTLVYEGSTSGDVSCPPQSSSGNTSSPAETLYTDAMAIENDVAAKLSGFKR